MKEVQILFDYLKNMKEITYNENCLEFYILLIFTLYRKEKRQINFYELMENIKLKLNFLFFLIFLSFHNFPSQSFPLYSNFPWSILYTCFISFLIKNL